MTKKRMAGTIAVAFVVSEILEIIVHGFVLAGDYAPYYGSLLRSNGDAPSPQQLLLPVAHLCFIGGLVWLYARLPLSGTLAVKGLKIGALGWLIGQAPHWMLWYAEQPWPGALLVKQLVLELAASLVIGLTIALVGGHAVRERPLAA